MRKICKSLRHRLKINRTKLMVIYHDFCLDFGCYLFFFDAYSFFLVSVFAIEFYHIFFFNFKIKFGFLEVSVFWICFLLNVIGQCWTVHGDDTYWLIYRDFNRIWCHVEHSWWYVLKRTWQENLFFFTFSFEENKNLILSSVSTVRSSNRSCFIFINCL